MIQPTRARRGQPDCKHRDDEQTEAWFFSARSQRALRLCGERTFNNTHRRDAEDTEVSQRDASLEETFVKLKIQNPVTLSATQRRQAGDGIFSGKEKSLRPEHLFAGVQKLQQRPGRSPGFCIAAKTEATIFTVARPRGILTRFPILPARSGTPKRI